MPTLHYGGRVWINVALMAFLLFASSANAALFNRKWNDDRLQLTPEKSRTQGEWRAGVDLLKSNRRNGINVEIQEGNSTYGYYLPTEMAPRVEGKTTDGSALSFSIATDSGDFNFDGVVKGKIASGHYVFEPNKQFAEEAGKLLKTQLTDEDLLKLAFARIKLAFIRGVVETGITTDLNEIIRLRNHGLDPDGIKAYASAGFKEIDDLIRLKNHGVTPAYATKARALGYGQSAEELTRMRNHGVTPEFLQEWKDTGYTISAEEAIKLRNFGVPPQFAAAWKKAGFEFNTEELIRARNHGVQTDFAAALAAAGTKPFLDEIVRMRNHGVSADYYTLIKSQSPNYSVDEIIRFRQFGVPADYIKTLLSNRADFTAEQIVKLRSHGVPADYIAALNVPDRKPLDAESIIDLRNRGVSAQTARKLRE